VEIYCVHPPDKLGAEVDHSLTVEISIEFTPSESRGVYPPTSLYDI